MSHIKHAFLVTAHIAVIVVGIASCGESQKAVNTNDGKIVVSGTVFSWVCSVGYPYTGSLHDHRYTMDFGERAAIAFVDTEGVQDSCLTDDSSNFRIELLPGTYHTVLYTAHSEPREVGDLSLTADTSLHVNFVLSWLEPDTVFVDFWYGAAADSIGEVSERAYLLFMKDRTGDMLIVDSAPRYAHVIQREPAALYVRYSVPVNREYRLWQVHSALDSVLDVYSQFFPQHMSIPKGYNCLLAGKHKTPEVPNLPL